MRWRYRLGLLIGAMALAVAQDRDVDEPSRERALARAREIADRGPSREAPAPSTLDVTNYVVRLRLDLAAGHLAGEVALTLRPREGARQRITLDAADLTLQSVTTEDGDALSFEQAGNQLIVDLGRIVGTDESTGIRLAYEASPRAGMNFVTDRQGRRQVWTGDARSPAPHWLPCHAHPDDPATVDLELTVPNGFVTVASGALLESRDAGEGWRTDHWRTPALPIDRVGVLAGVWKGVDLGQVGAVTLQAWCAAEDASDAGTFLTASGRVLAWMQERLGVAFPASSLQQVFVAGRVGSGVPAHGVTLWSEERWESGPDDATAAEVERRIVRELIPQWWDPAALHDHPERWLAEGLARYAEILWLEETHGPAEAAAALVAEQERITRSTSGSGRVVGAGAAFLHLLRGAMGDAPFFELLRSWAASVHAATTRPQDEPANTRPVADFATLAVRQGGDELAPLLQAWLERDTVPDLRFTWRHEPATGELILEAEQRQGTDPAAAVFAAPLAVEFATAEVHRREVLSMTRRQQEWRLACAEPPAYVRFNDGGGLYGTIVVQQPLDAWIRQLREAPDAAGRMQAAAMLATLSPRLDREQEPGDAGNDWTHTMAALCRAALNDPDAVVRIAAAQALGARPGPTALLALDCAMFDEDLRVRVAAATALARFPGDETAQLLLSRFPMQPSARVQAAMVRSIGALDMPRGPELLTQLVRSDAAPIPVRGAALSALVACDGESATEWAVKLSRREVNRALRELAIGELGRLATDHARARRTLLALLGDDDRRVLAATLDAMQNLRDGPALPALVEFHDRVPHEDLRLAARARIVELLER